MSGPVDFSVPEWMNDAKCLNEDTETFFPVTQQGPFGGVPKRVRGFCGPCEVKDECLEQALKTDSRFGIWGGISERKRAPLHAKYTRDLRNQP